MADYTRLTPKILENLLAEYDLGTFESMTPLDGGQANSSIKIKTQKGVFTLSVCDGKNKEEVLCLTRVLAYLETQDFPTTRLVTTRTGKAITLHDNKPVYIKQFLPGKVCPELSCDMLFQVGQTMAELHALSPPPGLPGQFPYGLKKFENLFDAKIFHPYIDWLKEKKEFLETAIDTTMARGFVHGDIFWDNLLFSNHTLVAVLDFEEACNEYKLFDIGMGLVGCCARNSLFSMDLVKHFLSGYQKVCPFMDAEKKQLKIFMEYAAVAASFWRFRQYNLCYPSPDKKDNYKELSSLADQVHAMDETWFESL